MERQKGFTLIELILFIIVMGVLAAGILAAFDVAMRNAPNIQFVTRALMLAEQRMEVIIGYSDIYGFTALTVDPCTTAYSASSLCIVPTGYTVSATVVDNWGGDTNYKEITVTVSGKANISLTSLISNIE